LLITWIKYNYPETVALFPANSLANADSWFFRISTSASKFSIWSAFFLLVAFSSMIFLSLSVIWNSIFLLSYFCLTRNPFFSSNSCWISFIYNLTWANCSPSFYYLKLYIYYSLISSGDIFGHFLPLKEQGVTFFMMLFEFFRVLVQFNLLRLRFRYFRV